MITKENFRALLEHLGFVKMGKIYTKTIDSYELKVDFTNEKLIYPDGLIAERDTTKNFNQPENFVVFECVHNLLQSGYKPEHIILEQGMPGGHGMTGGFCDIIVQDNDKQPYLLIECKTADSNKSKEFSRAWAKMQKDGGQLFNYYNSYRQAKWLCLYTSDFANEKVEILYHLISMTDNFEYLGNNKKLLSFEKVKAENGSKADYFKVWSETYQQDFISHNLFESEVFKIGNRPYNVGDLKIVDNTTIQKKYHQFATIMRQHNVSARENAFDKLVNLFLCKVVDEKVNPENLKVYWKGAASDNHYDLQDRLQQLYQIGMKEFLDEEVTYISEETINKAFYLFKNQKDETKRTVMEYFTQLKFYSNNPFAFLDVHNEKLFFQNAVILKEIVQMLQDIKLKNDTEQHQFLGDLFEGFLDQGVKQSEGQFFTPMPIVKFLISSLPLNGFLKDEKVPKVIDYACGAGHFLTEYATQIKPIVLESGRNLQEFYHNIYGIEKEYRLSKVAKVSAFMYGQDEMDIIYADALAQNEKIKDGAFSLLVANPPYSVKGFLATLSDEDKEKFTLYPYVSNEESFNAIEAFFVERAKQLLHSNGIAVIVLPSSILSNGNIYIKCREIILQYFDLIAIVEFGSGTFGKTGTNTATLFLRRKSNTPDLNEHYKNRVTQWQSGNFGFDGLFEDAHLLDEYCKHCGFDLVHYQEFLKASYEMPPEIVEYEIFQEYKKVFDSSSITKEILKRNKRDEEKLLREVNEAKKQKLQSDINERMVKLNKACVTYIKEIESDKLHHFMLAKNNPQEVLIIKMPSGKTEEKAFLGYEWSDAKGNEGIKYLNTQSNDDSELKNLQGINQIQTPLFNPRNLNDENKLNHLIRQNFLGNLSSIPEPLTAFASLLPLTQMLDFERAEFNKALRTSAQKKLEIVSKYPLVKLGDVCVFVKNGKNVSQIDGDGKYKVSRIETIASGKFDLNAVKYTKDDVENDSFWDKGDIALSHINSPKHLGKTALFDIDEKIVHGVNVLRLKINENLAKPYYVFTISKLDIFHDSVLRLCKKAVHQASISITDLKTIKIPIPPLEIQQKIIEECQKIDEEYENSRMKIEEYRAKIAQIFNDLEIIGGGGKLLKINELCVINPSKSEIKSLGNNLMVSFVEMASVSNNGFIEYKIDKPLGELRKGSYTYFRENDVIIAKITPCMENGKCALVTELTNQIGMGSSEFHVFRANQEKISPAFLFYSLNREAIRQEAEKNMTGSSGHRRVPISFYENLKIPVPDLAIQEKIVSQVSDIEAKIAQLQAQMSSIKEKKKAVLDKFLL
ncbi:restriction endonuclease [Campylobacter sp. 19-13652]|nr:restriction endonuclease [Campylobacter sp. 19-13652]